MQTLIQGAKKYGFRYSSPKAEAAAQFIIELDPLAPDFWVPSITANIALLWPDEEAISRAFEDRAHLQLADSAEYFFKNTARLAAPGYSPSQEDILRARLRTSGIVEKTFRIKDVDFKFLDVGGQRNERRKWIHCFDNVTAVIFVVALSEYNQVLYEDEKESRMHEAMRVFDGVVNNPFFRRVHVILFLNKIDLFQEKITRVPLRTCFPEYTGLDGDWASAADYIKQSFRSLSKEKEKEIFAHFTCATDTDNVNKVFADTRKIVLRHNLEKLGFV